MTLTTLVLLICVRELYTSERGYDPYSLTEQYSIKPEYIDPPLPSPTFNGTYG